MSTQKSQRILAQLTSYIEEFMSRHELFSRNKKAIVAVSGGADSLLLAVVMRELAQRGHFTQWKCLHIDHGLRTTSLDEAHRVARECTRLQIPLEIHSLVETPPQGNVESWARKKRYAFLKKEAQRWGEETSLYLGHHIDDSLEWFFRMLLGSSSGPMTWGIPVLNGSLKRPFHCLSKKQIVSFCRLLRLNVLHDPSNEDDRFQRNYFRLHIQPSLHELYPKGVAHYVERANEWARQRAVLFEKPKTHTPAEGIKIVELKEGDQWDHHRVFLVSAIAELSSAERGKIRRNLNSMLAALKTHGRRGPMDFSGGVKVFLYGRVLVFANKKGIEKLRLWDESWSQKEFLEVFELFSTHCLPFVSTRKGQKKLKRDPLFPRTLKQLLDQGQGMSLRI